MEIWSGSVSLPSNPTPLKGVCLIDSSQGGQFPFKFPKDAKLAVRDVVNPSLIPYYAYSAPILEFHVSDRDTAEWWKQRILNSAWLGPDEVDESQESQCPCGVILGIMGKLQHITDLLVYGEMVTMEQGSLITPPNSDVLDENGSLENRGELKKELRLFAAPLNIGLLMKATALPSPPSSQLSEYGSDVLAEFLSPLHSPSPKRKRMESLFDAATEFHKKAQRRGGLAIPPSVSQEDPSLFLSQIVQPSQLRVKEVDDMSSSVERDNMNETRTTSINESGLPPRPIPTIPSHVRRASLSRSRASSRLSLKTSPVLPVSHNDIGTQAKNANRSPEETISANKALLTRTILTCMRLYGYRRSKSNLNSEHTPRQSAPSAFPSGPKSSEFKASFTTSSTGNIDLGVAENEDDVFKSMYHAVYRASTFALRRFLKSADDRPAIPIDGIELPRPTSESIPILDRGKATHVCDLLLSLFCEGG